MRMPYEGERRFTQRYGSNADAYKRFGMNGHNGLDVALPGSTPLFAVRRGVWNRYSDPTGYGINGTLTDEDGGDWIYGHLQRHVALTGQVVEEGALLAYSDNTGNSTGNHLHFGYRPFGYDRNNGYLGWINPRPFLPLPYRLLIQAGHVGAKPASGAPREAEWNAKMAGMLAERLAKNGVEVTVIGDFYNLTPPAEVARDYDLCVVLHYDAAIYAASTGNSGCCIARGLYETEWWEADRFLKEWKDRYPQATGIPLHQERVNANMTEYYAWRHLTYITPGVLLEHGVGAPGTGLDAPVLWGKPELVADTDTVALLNYLGISIPMEPKLMAILSSEERYEAINKAWGELRGVPAVKGNGFYTSWEESLLAGDYKGLPVGGEMGTTFGTLQCFDHGMAVWKPNQPVSWKG